VDKACVYTVEGFRVFGLCFLHEVKDVVSNAKVGRGGSGGNHVEESRVKH